MKKKEQLKQSCFNVKIIYQLCSFFLMLKINVLIKGLPNSQSPKILCHYKKKDLFRYDFSRKTLETLYNVNHSIWLQCLHRRLLVRFDDIGVVLRFRPLQDAIECITKKCKKFPKRVYLIQTTLKLSSCHIFNKKSSSSKSTSGKAIWCLYKTKTKLEINIRRPNVYL